MQGGGAATDDEGRTHEPGSEEHFVSGLEHALEMGRIALGEG